MAEPIDLNTERAKRDETYDGTTCPECGGAWFNVQAVALNAEGHVAAFVHPLTCRECGHLLRGGAWATPDLTVAPDRQPPRLGGCTCGRVWDGHPNPHAITCPLHDGGGDRG